MSQHFNEIAKEWDKPETVMRTKQFANAIKQALGTLDTHHFDSILDLGCGTGLLLEHFADQFNELVGVDTSSGMLDVFKSRFGARANGLLLDLEKNDLPKGVGPFDVIISSMAFHHLSDPQAMLNKLKSYLRPNGKIFIIDLDEEDGTFHPDNIGMGVKHYGFSQNKLAKWSKETGFANFHHDIIYSIEKNARQYGVALSQFS